EQRAIFRNREHSVAENRIELHALRDRDSVSGEFQLSRIKRTCQQGFVDSIDQMPITVGNVGAAMKQDAIDFSVQRTQNENIVLVGRSEHRSHVKEVVSVRKKIRPAVGCVMACWIE